MVKPDLYQKDYDSVMDYLNGLKKNYSVYLNEVELYNEVKAIILENNFDEKSDYLQLFDYACNLYKAVATFPTLKGKLALEELFSLKKGHLKWVTDFKQLINEIDRVNKSDKVYLPYFLVVSTYFSLYIPTKIRLELIEAFGLFKTYDGDKKNEIEILLFKYFQNIKNRKSSGNEEVKKSYEKELTILIKLIDKKMNIEGISIKSFLTSEASGRVEEIYITPIFSSLIAIGEKPLKVSDKYVLLFDLFRFIMKDKKWLSEDEFNNREIKVDNKGNPIGLYNNSYRRYQIITMKKFIEKK